VRYFRPSTQFIAGNRTVGGPWYGEGEVPEGEAQKPNTLEQITSYIPAIRGLVFGESAREEEARLQERILNYEELARNSGGLIRNAYLMELDKLRAQLLVVQQKAGEERDAAALEGTTRAAVAVGAVALVVVALGMAFNQVQKARLLQAKIRKEEV